MRLKSLKVHNFKGLKDFELAANGGNVNVYGDNATGKTTLKDAFTWLLFDKDSQGRADFDIKTIDGKTGEAIHNLRHEVTGTLELDGKELTLKKSYYEKWTKQRGSAEKTFTGHTTDYFIDSVPKKKSEYDAKIAEIAGSDGVFKLLTDPAYFNTIHWQERRKILLEVCGDISDEDVIKSDEKLADLKDILTNRNLEDERRVLKNRQKDINKELERVPIRIDEVNQGLPDISNIQPEKIKPEIEKLRKQKKEKEAELVRLESGGEVAEKTKRLREIESELLELKNKHWMENEKEITVAQKQLDEAKTNQRDIQHCIDSMGSVATNALIEEYESEMDELRDEWENINVTVFEFEQNDVCPTCGQKLPEERLQEARDKALANFNQEKATKLERISKNGKRLKAEVEGLQKDVKTKETEIEKHKKNLEPLQAAIKSLTDKIATLQSNRTDISENKDYQEKLKEQAAITEEIESIRKASGEVMGGIRQAIDELQDQIGSLEYSMSQIRQHTKGTERIEELKVQEKQLAAEYEKLEKELYLLDEFTKIKVNLLEKKINSKFKLARFKLFNILVNGGIEECCETLFQGIPYSTALNSAAQINVGLDVINSLSKHYGFEAPIFIDGAEGVTDFLKVNAQMIKFYVSEKDKSLRIEHE